MQLHQPPKRWMEKLQGTNTSCSHAPRHRCSRDQPEPSKKKHQIWENPKGPTFLPRKSKGLWNTLPQWPFPWNEQPENAPENRPNLPQKDISSTFHLPSISTSIFQVQRFCCLVSGRFFGHLFWGQNFKGKSGSPAVSPLRLFLNLGQTWNIGSDITFRWRYRPLPRLKKNQPRWINSRVGGF